MHVAKANLKPKEIKMALAIRSKNAKWLALKIGTSYTYLSQLMTGRRHPSPALREKIMSALEVKNFHDLFTIAK